MKNIFCICLLSAMTMISCKGELQPQESITEPTSTEADATVENTTTPEGEQTTVPVTPNTQQAQPMPSTPSTMTPAPAKMQAGLNPAHGQPGHRCDIAVGAPLSSAPAKPANNQIQMQTPAPTPAPTTATPSILNPSAATATAPGMNPPHGQPGHRCDITVGAPLPK
ncbi:MAG: hypothetical protein IR153_06965 [Flavobacterium sp.]|nr:hypothetical protein [Flavobacterium sp.]